MLAPITVVAQVPADVCSPARLALPVAPDVVAGAAYPVCNELRVRVFGRAVGGEGKGAAQPPAAIPRSACRNVAGLLVHGHGEQARIAPALKKISRFRAVYAHATHASSTR